MSDEITVTLDMGDDTGLLDHVFPKGVWLRVMSGGLCPEIEVRGPIAGVVYWVNNIYACAPDVAEGHQVPPILNDDGSWANTENPGLPKGY